MGTLEDFLKRHGYKAETQADNENEENGELDAFYSRHNYDPNKNTKTTESPTASANVENRELNAFYSRHNYDPNKDTTITAGQGNPAQPTAVLPGVVKPAPTPSVSTQMEHVEPTEPWNPTEAPDLEVPEAGEQTEPMKPEPDERNNIDFKLNSVRKIFPGFGQNAVDNKNKPNVLVAIDNYDAAIKEQENAAQGLADAKTPEERQTASQRYETAEGKASDAQDVLYNELNKTYATMSVVSQYKSWDEYHAAYLEGTIDTGDEAKNAEERRRIFKNNQAEIAKLDVRIKNGKATDYEKSRRENLASYNTAYERGLKAADDYLIKYHGSADEKTYSNQRNFTNPTRDECDRYDSRKDGSLWKYDAEGNCYNVFGELVFDKNGNFGEEYYVDEYGNILPSKKPKITDPLGLFLEAQSNGELENSLSTPMDFEGSYDTFLKDANAAAWQELTDDEINIYYTILNKEGLDAAEKYLYAIRFVLTKRYADSRVKMWSDYVENGGFLESAAATAYSVPANIIGGIAAGIRGIGDMLGITEYDPNANTALIEASAIRGNVAGKIDAATKGAKALGISVGDIYQFFMSAVDSVTGGSVAGKGYAVIMGCSAASNKAKELWDKGASTDQIVTNALISGALEVVTEYVSLDKLFEAKNVRTFTELLHEGLKQAGIEASEELASEIGNILADAAIMGDQGEVKAGVRKLMDEGYSETEAYIRYVGERLYEAGVGGFISGGMSVGLYSGTQYVKSSRLLKTDGNVIIQSGGVNDLLDNADNLLPADGDRSSAERQLARFAENVRNDPTAKNVGLLADQVRIVEMERTQSDIASELVSLGYRERAAQKIAETIVQANEYNADEKTMLYYDALIQDGDIYEIVRNHYGNETVNVQQNNNDAEQSAEGVNQTAAAGTVQAETQTAQTAQEQAAPAHAEQTVELGVNRNTFTPETAAEDAQSVVELHRQMERDGTLQNRAAAEELLKTAETATVHVQNAEATGRLTAQAAYDSEIALRQVIESAKTVLAQNNTPAQTTAPVQNIEIGGMDNGRTEGITDGTQRNEGMGADQQGQAVQRSAEKATERGRNASIEVRRAVVAGEYDRASAKSLGIRGGSESETMQILRESVVDRIDALRTIRDEAAKDGVNVKFFAGTIAAYNKFANRTDSIEGVYLPDSNTVYVKADKVGRGPAQIYSHEMMHKMMQDNPGMLDYALQLLGEQYTPEELEQLVDRYCEAYHGIYGTISESMSADEKRDVFMKYVEEICADAYAGIRRGGINTVKAEQVMAAFRSDRTDGGREYAAATERTNGPGENKTAGTEDGGKVMYSVEEYDPETASLKEQLDNAQVELKQMQVVTNQRIDLSEIQFASKAEAKAWANKALRQWNGRVDRQGFGEIFFSKSNIDYAIEHLSDRYQQAAFCALPYVLKRGIQIGEHNDHRGRGKHTITFAAPIEINGTRGNMAVVVNIHGKHAYAARVLLPDGTAFVFGEMKETPQGMHQGVLKNESLADTTSGASNTRIADSSEDVKQRFSIEDDSDYLSLAEKYRDGTASEEETAELQELVDQAAKDAEFNIKAYHGTQRADRVGTVFRPDRSTSGPMAFFTDNRSIAENYARDKADTSLAYDSDYDSYETQFRFRNGKDAKYPIDAPIAKAWGYIPFADRAKILRNAGNLHFDWDGETGREFILDKDTNEAGGGFQWQLKEHRGNVIAALIEQWLNSANLFEEEGRFLDVLKMTGVTDALKSVGLELYYKDPNYREDKVYDTWLKITQPFDVTTQVNEAFVEGFEEWYNEQDQSKYERESVSADFWDKNNVTAEMFAERMRADIERNQSHAWTSIPDSATDYLKHLGYNGIKDTGGKNGGDIHTVWVPFSSDQVRSADPVTYDDEGNIIPLSERFRTDRTGEEAWKNSDIRYSVEDDAAELDEDYRRAVRKDAAEDEPTEKGRSFLPQRDAALGPDYAAVATEEIERRAKEASLKELRQMLKTSEAELNKYRWAKRKGILPDELAERMKTVEDTVKIQSEELKHKNAEERKQREKRQDEEAKRQQPRIAKRELKAKLAESFHVAPGQRAITNDLIEQAANKILQRGYLDAEDKRSLFNALLKSGVVNIAPEGYYGEIRSYVQQGRIYVPESIREEFGDDWADFRKRAWGNRIYLTNDTTDRPIDDWNQDLAQMFPGGFEEGATDMKEALEQIVRLAEEGSAENITIAEMMERNQDNYGWTVESQMEGLEDQLDAALKSFAETAGVEIRVRQEKATEVLKERRRMREMIERESARRRESEQRNRVMREIQRLNRMRNRTAPEVQAQIDEVLNGIDTVARSISDRGLENLIDIAKAYEQAKADNPNFIPNPYVEARLARLQQTQLDDMEIGDVIELGRVVSALVHSVQEANRLHSEEYKAEIDATARSFVEEMKATKGSKGGKLYQWAVENHLSPVRMIRHLGGWAEGGASAQIAQSLENGQTRQMRYLMEASRLFDSFLASKENKTWLEKASGKNAEWIKVSVPVNYDVNENDQTEIKWQDIEITPMMRVALYMHSLNFDNLRHIEGGGMTIPNRAYYEKGDMQNAYAYGTRVKMTPETVRAIVKDMTEQERTFAGLLREYYDRYSKDHINEVSMILDGFERAGGENYYHIKTDQNFLSKLPDNIQKNISLESIGSIVNERVFSKVPIVLEDASVSLADHIQQISKYYGFAVPIHDFTAIMNFTDHEMGNIFSGSVRELMGQQWGAGAQKYLNKLMEDLQSSSGINEMTATFLRNLRGKLAGASLMFNPAVALSQTASYPGAMQTLGARALAEGLKVWERVDTDLIEKYSPLLWYRNQGNSTQELGDYMDGQTLEHKLPWLLGWIQKMDSATVRRLWAASEYYVKNNTDLRPGSEAEIAAGTDEYYQKVAEMFNRAVYDTQPNYSTMQRPQILRSNSDLTKFLTMFKTVPLQYYNMMFEATGRLTNAKRRGNAEEIKSAAGYFARTAVGLISANAIYVAMKALFKVLRFKDKDYRDEEGELTFGSFMKQLGLDFLDTSAGSLIGGAELLDIVERIAAAVGGEKQRYNGVDINALSFVASIAQDVMNLGSAIGSLDGKDLASALKDIVKDGVMGTLGLPAQNAETYLLALVKWISPETAERYENLFSDRSKSSLSEESGRYLEAAISVYMDNRTEDLPDEVKQELQRLWEAGQKNAIPSAVPSSVTVGGESIALTSAQKAQFREDWSRIVSENLEALIGTEYYQSADETTQGKMIDRLYQYAAQIAKSNLDIGFTADRWVTAADEENLQEYLTYCTLRSMMDRQADEATNTAAVAAVMDYVIGGLSEDDCAEIARLYMGGAEGLIPTLAPEEFTYKNEDGTEYAVKLDAAAQRRYAKTYREAVGDQLSVLMSSPEFADTDDKTRAALIGKIFDFAAGVAKAEVAEGYTPDKWIVNGMENMEDGIRLADYIIYNTERQHINGKNEDGDTESGLKDRRTFDLIDSNDWTDDQKISVYLDTCSTAAAGKVQAMDAAGFSWRQIKTVMLADKPEYAVLEANISDNAKLKVLGEFCNATKMIRYQTGKMFGVSFKDYAEVVQKADTNGSGSISQDEATAYIKNMGLYPQQAAYLWQMVTDGKNGKNNPFSPTWGAEFYYEMHKNDNN